MTREVGCPPCTKQRYTGECGRTRMIVHEHGHAWCVACGTKRELGEEVVND